MKSPHYPSHFLKRHDSVLSASYFSSSGPSLDDLRSILAVPPSSRSEADIGFLAFFTGHIKFFADMIASGNAESHRECCRAFTYERHPAGEFLFEAGEEGSKFYVIISGSCGVLTPVKRYKSVKAEYRQLTLLRQGEYFGELALINYKPRAASVICREESNFAVLERNDYLRVLAKAHDQTLKSKLQLLLHNPAFSSWSKAALRSLSYFFRERQYKRGQTLFHSSESPKEIFIISKGEFQLSTSVSRSTEGSVHRLDLDVALVTSGELLGAEEVVSGGEFQYTCVCRSTQGEVIYITKEDFSGRVRNEETISHFHSMSQAKEEYRLVRIHKMIELAELTREEQFKGHRRKPLFPGDTSSQEVAVIKARLERDKANREFLPGIVVPTARVAWNLTPLGEEGSRKNADSMLFPSRMAVTRSDLNLSRTHACPIPSKKHPNWADIVTRKYAIDKDLLSMEPRRRQEVVNYHRQALRVGKAASIHLQRHSDLSQTHSVLGMTTINMSLETEFKTRPSDLA